MSYYCRLCRAFDESGSAVSHRCSATNDRVVATNTLAATNTATNERLTSATNRKDVDIAARVGGDAVAVAPIREVFGGGVSSDRERRAERVSGEGVGVVSRTANRRSREAYNAYQREYMKARRLRVKEN